MTCNENKTLHNHPLNELTLYEKINTGNSELKFCHHTLQKDFLFRVVPSYRGITYSYQSMPMQGRGQTTPIYYKGQGYYTYQRFENQFPHPTFLDPLGSADQTHIYIPTLTIEQKFRQFFINTHLFHVTRNIEAEIAYQEKKFLNIDQFHVIQRRCNI